jgi:hypothetical protein
MANHLFVSHTKRDKEFCDAFDVICARVGIKAFRSEFEAINVPAWKSIKDEIARSRAVFLLIGRALAAAQADSYDPHWKYTQNWIAFEIGLACQRGIDVWVVTDEGIDMNFPVPYLNNYWLYGVSSDRNREAMRSILDNYNKGYTFGFPSAPMDTSCPYANCGVEFNLWAELAPGSIIKCPQCLMDIQFEHGFSTSES